MPKPQLMPETIITCPGTTRKMWPEPQAHTWRHEYPQLFDASDLKLAMSQPNNHFSEWFAAIHLYHRDGVLSLIEKYAFTSHPVKEERMSLVLAPEKRAQLLAIIKAHNCQPPDLLLYNEQDQLVGFGEVKGPGDKLSKKQIDMIQAIQQSFEVPVEIIRVKLT